MWIKRDNDPRRGYEIRESKNGERLGYARTSTPGVHYDWEAWCDSSFSSFICGRVGSGHRSRLSAAHRLLEHHEAKHR
jgi:hypothetical protein